MDRLFLLSMPMPFIFKAGELMTMPKEARKPDLWTIQEQRAELGSLVYPSLQILNEGSRMQSRYWEKTNHPPVVYLLKAASLKGRGSAQEPLRSSQL